MKEHLIIRRKKKENNIAGVVKMPLGSLRQQMRFVENQKMHTQFENIWVQCFLLKKKKSWSGQTNHTCVLITTGRPLVSDIC